MSEFRREVIFNVGQRALKHVIGLHVLAFFGISEGIEALLNSKTRTYTITVVGRRCHGLLGEDMGRL